MCHACGSRGGSSWSVVDASGGWAMENTESTYFYRADNVRTLQRKNEHIVEHA